MLRFLLFTVTLCVPLGAFAQQFHIITLNEEFEVLRVNQAKMIFRGRVAHINGLPTQLLDLPERSPHRELFYKVLLKKTPSQMNAIWARQSFSGKASAPAELPFEDRKIIKDWLQKHPNGIAYVPDSLLPSGVRILYTLDDQGSL